MEQRSNRSRTLWLIVALALLAGASAVGRQSRTAAAPLAPPPVDFAPPSFYGVDGGARSLVTGDFNEDGWPDLAGVLWGGQRLFILLNTGDGAFAFPSIYNPNNGGLWHLDTGDLNNDGNLDIVTANRQYGGTSIYLGNGAGAFQFLATRSIGGQPTDVKLADFNQDGNLDAVFGDFSSSLVRVFLGLGTGSFGTPQSYPAAAGAYAITLADLNADTNLDMVVANRNAASMTVLLGSASGSFTPTTYPAGSLPCTSGVGDVDGDGDADIVLANCSSSMLSIFKGNGAGAFTLFGSIPGYAVGAVVLHDLNFDGALDIIINNGYPSATSGLISVNLGNGDGTFQSHTSWQNNVGSGYVVGGDLNKDGLYDIASANYYSQDGKDVSIFYGRPVALPTATSTATATATATSTSTPTTTATATATLAPTATATSTATETPTSTATATPTSPPGAKAPALYLPLIANTRPRLLVAINPLAIASRPVAQVGEVYYTTTVTLSAPLPAGGRFYLSAAPDSLTPVQVDDELAVTVGGEEVYTRFLTYPRVVELPRSLLESWLGQPVTVVFRDAYGAVVGSTPVWLIWQP